MFSMLESLTDGWISSGAGGSSEGVPACGACRPGAVHDQVTELES